MAERDEGAHASAAAVLERRTEDVLAAFEAALLSAGTAIADTEHGTAPHLDEARRTLAHVTAELRRGTYLPTGTDDYALELGPAAGPGGARTHPADSRRAAAALFDAVVVTLLGGPAQDRLDGAEMAV
ncbi:hypothetical protein, partial [Streptomyces triticagri]|uniref:hypothetical protein n=1 Tax=Streptomyces triticagri TaxID=2293568 RepID=UPI001F3B28F2